MRNMEEKKGKSAGPADHLANERTFLAWVRTSIALMGFGFVIVKFSLFVKQISYFIGDKELPSTNGYSALVGVFMVILGAVISLLAYLRYRNIQKQLENSLFFPSKQLSVSLTIGIIVASILLVIYLLQNIFLN